MGIPITTEDGFFITTESGLEITTDGGESSNDDIQILDFNVNVLQALLWQYNEADNLQAIAEGLQTWYTVNQEQFWQSYLTNVFDLRTANEFGLSLWAILLDIPLFVSSTPDDLTTKPTIGFDNAYFKNFDRGNFSSKTGGTSALSLATKRLALQLRYFQLITSGCVPEVNRFLAYVFSGYGPVSLIDNNDMTQTYFFRFPVTADLQYLFDNFDILPRPAGVESDYRDGTRASFGFAAFGLNFDRGNFGAN